MHFEPSFQKRYHKALSDPAMIKAVKNGTGRLRGQRAASIEAVGQERWTAFRDRAEGIRLHVIQHLDQYLEQLVDNVLKKGGHVCLAKTGEEAVQYIAKLAQKKNAKSIIKSKSMVSEEIHLNPELEKLGCEVIESDLGEYIIQLAGETPSHIIAPAMHKNRFQVADLFNAVSKEKLSTEIGDLCGFAREHLREKFLGIDIGITGCNFAIADSGAITLCTNEGNARIISALAPTLVTIMGMERILPSIDDLAVMLSLLARSATGQKLTVYNTLSTGVRDENELDGPQEFHLVIKDRNELGQALKQIIQERQLQKVMRWDHPELEKLKLEEIFSDTKASLSRWPLEKKYSDWIGKAAAMDAGIVWADIVMAETGTIVLPTASPGQPASLCVLPLTLIAIFTTSQLVDGLASVMKILKKRYGINLPTTTTFISGPSRTTDIEMVLTIGVHGSRYVYALILDE